MKKLFTPLLLIAFSISCSAQTDNWYFSFSMGGSRPLGTFQQKNIDDQESGYAKSGFTLVLDATYPLSDHWGLRGSALVNTSTVDRNWLGTKLETRMTPYVTVPEADRPYLSMRTNAWLWNSLMIGPVYSFNFDKVFWDFQLLGGMNVTYLPQQKMLFEKPANNWFYLDRNTTSSSVSYGLMAGTSLRFPISDRVNLKVGFDYFQSKAQIKYEQFKVTKTGDTQTVQIFNTGSYSIPIKMISGTIGFVYYLD